MAVVGQQELATVVLGRMVVFQILLRAIGQAL